jgi:hypothetical protein
MGLARVDDIILGALRQARGTGRRWALGAQGGDVLDVVAMYMHVYYVYLGDEFAGIWERI